MVGTRLLDTVENDAALPDAVDLVVIGAGMIGVAAAYAAAKAGHSVALLEKGVVAGEQSSRNWGWCRVLNRDEREIPLMQHSMALWDSLPAEIGADMGFRRAGLTYVTKDPAQLAGWQAWLDMAQPYQVQARVIDAAEARRLTPGNQQAGNEQDWVGGVVSPHDGRAEPAMAAPALARAAQALGVSLHQNCAVRGLDTTGGRISGVFTEKGRIRCHAVVLAGGAWASMFLRRHGIDMPQSSVHSTVFATTPAKQVSTGPLLTPDFILTPLLDGGYLVAAKARGRLELPPAGIQAARIWAGWIDSTPDAVPVISQVEALPGLVVAAGFSGHGFGIGPGAGRLAADLATDAACIVDPAPFTLKRFAPGAPRAVARAGI